MLHGCLHSSVESRRQTARMFLQSNGLRMQAEQLGQAVSCRARILSTAHIAFTRIEHIFACACECFVHVFEVRYRFLPRQGTVAKSSMR